MTLHAPYDPSNIFAKILRGEMPAIEVYQDDVALAFMDIFPQSAGHTLIIPKHIEATNFLDMPRDKLGAFMERVQKVAIGVEKALTPDGIIVTQFNGAPAGQTVFHLHFHIIPRFIAAPMTAHASGQPKSVDELEPLAAKIRKALSQ